MRIDSLTSIIGAIAMRDPDTAFDVARTVEGMREWPIRRQPDMMDYDGDPTRPYGAVGVEFHDGPVSVVEYPYGTDVVVIGSEALTIVRRTRRGEETGTWTYVHAADLERFRATGRFGEIEDHDPGSFLELLTEHGLLAEFGIDPRGDETDAAYVAFLRERGACDGVIAN